MGKSKDLVDLLIREKAKGNSFQEMNIQMKLMLKGINIKKITDDTPDDPATIAKIYEVAKEFNVDLEKLKSTTLKSV